MIVTVPGIELLSRALAQKEFTEKDWDLTVGMVAQTFRFTAEETDAFAASKTARLIAAIPYLAGCPDARRISLAHLSVYITAIRGGREIFDHTPDDNSDIMSRLRLIMSFTGGDPSTIEHGMSLLALIMVNGYRRHREKDALSGEYNPLNDGQWDFDAISATLTKRIQEISNPDIERILPLAYAPPALWN